MCVCVGMGVGCFTCVCVLRHRKKGIASLRSGTEQGESIQSICHCLYVPLIYGVVTC